MEILHCNSQLYKMVIYFNCENARKSIIIYAWFAGSKEIVSVLIMNGTDINHQNSDLKTALHLAIEVSGNIEIINLLIDAGVELNAQDYQGYTALHRSIEKSWFN